MGYDISLCDPVTHETLKADSVHFIAGGVRIVGGTEKLMCYVTWNYRKFYRRNDVLGKKGIRSIYGKTGAESIPMLEKAGLQADIRPVRGGTDGAQLSCRGLPCPNLGTGGYGFHGPYEHISIQDMEKATEIILNLVTEK